MPPVFFVEPAAGIEPSTAALKPMVTLSTLANRTTCSIAMPSEPVTLTERELTAYDPSGGLTVLGATRYVRSALSFGPTSQTRLASSE